MYAFAIALGLSELFIGADRIFSELTGNSLQFDVRFLLTCILFLNIILLGIRFFWVPRNLRRLAVIALKSHLEKKGDDKKSFENSEVLPNYLSASHMIIIILHGAIFYFICSEFSYIIFILSSSIPLNSSIFQNYLLLHIGLLLLNSFWIAIIAFIVSKITAGLSTHNIRDPGNSWWRNNAICGLLALGPLSITDNCRSTIQNCIDNTESYNEFGALFIPISPDIITSVYNINFNIMQYFNIYQNSEAHLHLVVWCSFMFFINSIIDLWNTGTAYLFIEDMEFLKSDE